MHKGIMDKQVINLGIINGQPKKSENFELEI